MNSITLLTEDQIRDIVGDAVRSVFRVEMSRKQTNQRPVGYVTRYQVCEQLHITLPTVHKWIKEGKLKPYHIGGRTLFKEDEVLSAVKPVNYSLTK